MSFTNIKFQKVVLLGFGIVCNIQNKILKDRIFILALNTGNFTPAKHLL